MLAKWICFELIFSAKDCMHIFLQDVFIVLVEVEHEFAVYRSVPWGEVGNSVPQILLNISFKRIACHGKCGLMWQACFSVCVPVSISGQCVPLFDLLNRILFLGSGFSFPPPSFFFGGGESEQGKNQRG